MKVPDPAPTASNRAVRTAARGNAVKCPGAVAQMTGDPVARCATSSLLDKIENGWREVFLRPPIHLDRAGARYFFVAASQTSCVYAPASAAFLMTLNFSAMSAVRLNASGFILPNPPVGAGGPQISLLISVIIQV